MSGYSKTSNINSIDIKVTYIKPPKAPLSHTLYTRNNQKAPVRIVLVHGFTQTSKHFDKLARLLVSKIDSEVVAIDLPHHGTSKRIDGDLIQTSDKLLELGQKSIWVGYSLGSRHVLAMCARHPNSPWNVILSGVNPGIENVSERQDRYSADLQIASELQSINGNKVKFREFLEQWTSQPLFMPRKLDPTDIDLRLENTPSCLAQSLRQTSVGNQENYWPIIPLLKGRFRLITGSHDNKYLKIAERIQALNGDNFRLTTIDSLGHAAIFDDLETTSQVIENMALEYFL